MGGQGCHISGGHIGELTQKLYDTLTGIQWGKLPDTKLDRSCGISGEIPLFRSENSIFLAPGALNAPGAICMNYP